MSSDLVTCLKGFAFKLRSLSDVQESAQLLTGLDFPNQVLSTVLGKLNVTQGVIINTTPYDGCLESAVMVWHKNNDMKLDYLSVSRVPGIIEYVEKKIALQLLQAWFELRLP